MTWTLRYVDHALDVEAARALAELMGEISEDYYAAGWIAGLEFSLWTMVALGGSRHFGMGAVSEIEIRRLRHLSERADGWIVWRDVPRLGEPSGESFLSMANWLAVFRQWQKGAYR